MKAHGTWIWAMLALCAALVLGAMTWLTRHVVGSERERAAAEARADLQERVRLGLWRMDAVAATIIVEENQRPVGEGSPVEGDSAGVVKMRFEVAENGAVSARYGEQHLPDLRQLLERNSGGAGLFPAVREKLKEGRVTWEANLLPPAQAHPQAAAPSAVAGKDVQQEYYNAKERAVRGKAVESQLQKSQATNATRAALAERDAVVAKKAAADKPAEALPKRSEALADTVVPASEAKAEGAAGAFAVPSQTPSRWLLEVGPPRPAWLGGQLFLLRNTRWGGAGHGRAIEGVWIEAEKLTEELLGEVRDLLPFAKLIPSERGTPDGMVLASFPLRLESGESPRPSSLPRPIAVSLAAGWLAAALAILAVAGLVRGILRLSERRASFVSAVTHELRTPLTTFRLYSDMLGAGAVKEEKRGDYLRVLSNEADRLSHLVENVLAFSRIERGNARAATRRTTVRELVVPLCERFAARLEAVGMELDCELSSPAAMRPLETDPAAFEHVLFNLIDNAAKYAASSQPSRVTLSVVDQVHAVAIRVRDHGPGIAATERKKIFRAFHKSAHEAAESKPGVGLGLALSRRLAKSLGGELRYEAPADGGACFVLILPVD